MKKCISTVIVAIFFLTIIYAVPAHPLKKNVQHKDRSQSSEVFKIDKNSRMQNLPDSTLVIRVEFSDTKFDLVPDYPDSIPHDKAYFERYMHHLKDYYMDASRGKFKVSSTVWDSVIVLSRPMGFYGDDDNSTERVAMFAEEIVELADAKGLDFSLYDSFIIFHAGAGQETDLFDRRLDEMWATFISRRDLQEGLDPNNDNFPGLPTNDGKYIKELVVCPETEWQSYYPEYEDISTLVFGMLGVLAHEFGHLLGLPTLFDTNSDNGSSAGIGDFGVMGTGSWNALGNVPPLPEAWSRCYLGWEEPVEINNSVTDLLLAHPQTKDPIIPTVYKINISEKEYFLIENREQNFTNSDVIGFDFPLLPDGEQDTYPSGAPKFNFMENSYKGCEWDFFCPGLGGPDNPIIADGSGLYIWHIDENIINATFTPTFDYNYVNGDANHKGVDLEEADQIQHMDTNYPDPYRRGSPFDAFRQGNNTYFGLAKNPEDSLRLSYPTAESYYGGIPVEIYNIGAIDTVMTFSVRFNWKLDSNQRGISPYPLAVENHDGVNNIFAFYPDGLIVNWENNNLSTSSRISPITKIWSKWEDVFFIPTYDEQYGAQLFLMNSDTKAPELKQTWAQADWISAPIAYKNRLIAAVRTSSADKIYIYNLSMQNGLYNLAVQDSIILVNNKIVANLVLDQTNDNDLSFMVQAPDSSYHVCKYDIPNHNLTTLEYSVNKTSAPLYLLQAVMQSGLPYSEYVIVTADKKLILLLGHMGMIPQFERDIPLKSISLPSCYDIDGNGYTEIIIGGENKLAVFDYSGRQINNRPVPILEDSVNVVGGAVGFTVDGKRFVLGTQSHNQLSKWSSDFKTESMYPTAYPDFIRNYPVLYNQNDTLMAYISTDNGYIYKNQLSSKGGNDVDLSNTYEYANLSRTGSYLFSQNTNIYQTSEIFVQDNCYIYPNPYNSINSSDLKVRLMVSRNCEVKIKIYNISGKMIYEQKEFCQKYLNEIFELNLIKKKLSSGVYFAIFEAEGKQIKNKFAVER